MGRTRTGTVTEPREQLLSLLDYYRGSHLEARLRFLLALRDDPRLKLAELVDDLEVSDRTLRRWWSDYLTGGLSAVVAVDVLEPVVAESGPADYSDRNGVDRLIRFLNAMPMTANYEQWQQGVRDALLAYLADTDDVQVSIARLESGTGSGAAPYAAPSARTATIPIGDETSEGWIHLACGSDEALTRAVQQLEELRPFLAFLMTDIIVRTGHDDAPPVTRDSTLTGPLSKALTPRERDVLVHRLSGYSYADTGALLSVSEETVRKCVKAIYRKTGVTSLGELFIRYFANLDSDIE